MLLDRCSDFMGVETEDHQQDGPTSSPGSGENGRVLDRAAFEQPNALVPLHFLASKNTEPFSTMVHCYFAGDSVSILFSK